MPSMAIFATLFGWGVLGSVALLFIGIGFGVMSMAPPEFLIARICFSFSATILILKTATWLVKFDAPPLERILASFVVFGIIGAAWVWSYCWVGSRVPLLKPPPPVAQDHKQDDKPPTLLDLFRKDFSNVLKGSDSSDIDAYTIGSPNEFTIKVKRQIYEDYEARTKFVGFYIGRPTPPAMDFSGRATIVACMELLNHDAVQETFNHFSKSVAVMSGYNDQMTTSKELTFSGRVLIYHEEFLSIPQKADILKAYEEKHLAVNFRGSDYLGTQVIAWHQQHDAKKE
ncbi:MAG: hypothetical protein WAL71_19010 [Terriglobales bacterium]|jgi:hypothetical protein